MSNVFIAFMLGAGLGAWVYNKMYRNTGGNVKNASIVAGIAGFGAFLLMMLILSRLPKF